MKMNNKGYASTIIMFSVLTLFFVCLLMLIQTMNNSKAINDTIKNNVIDKVDYDSSGSLQQEVQDLRNQLNNMQKVMIDTIYPIGSIYMSSEDSSIESVKKRFGEDTDWETYSVGTTLIGGGTTSDGNILQAGQTGGGSTVTLSVANLPSHNHTFTPSGTVSSTFKGQAVNSGYQSANHTHAYSGTTSSNGSHTHALAAYKNNFVVPSGLGTGQSFPTNGSGSTERGHWFTGSFYASSNGNHTHTFSGTTAGNSQNHTHSVTAAGTVSSSFSGSSSQTGSTGSNTAFSVQNPYTVIYMYKRIK